jgi:adenine-specific DNA-methyltransferase
MSGAGDKKTDRDPVIPGTDAVALLHDLTRFREALARSIARNNLELRSDQITAAVNRILFPLLLLRIAEDRHQVPEGTLDALRNCRSSLELISDLAVYADLLYADEPSSSPHPPVVGNDLVIEARDLLMVLDSLTSPCRRYDFQDMATPVISRVLMHYLTRTIRRSAAHQATVVDTHDTVVSGGTVIPPDSLVDYLARQALVFARKNRSQKEIIPLRVCDPSCGSGTVLLGMYRHLLEKSGRGPILTFDERREILVNSVYGLDISRHAVAVTRMLLLSELCNIPLEGIPKEGFSTIAGSVLRDLRHTVLCGNALIGTDIVRDESWMFCPARDRHTLNPFSYGDRFPEIFAGGGFDIIVCNPPEGALEQREWIQQYFQRRYSVYHPKIERSAYFVEKSLSLVSPGGTVSCITSNRWLRGPAGSPLREMLGSRQIEEIVDLSSVPEGKSGAGLCLLHVRAIPPAVPFMASVGDYVDIDNPDTFVPSPRFPVDQVHLDKGGWVFRDTRAEEILRKVSCHGMTLEDFVMGQVHRGIKTSTNNPLVIDESLGREWLKRDPRCKSLLRSLIAGNEIGRFHPKGVSRYLLMIPQGWTLSHPNATKKPWQWLKHRHPIIARYLQPHADMLKSRAGPDTLWWETPCDDFWTEPRKKILFPSRFKKPVFLSDAGRGIGDETTCAIPSSGLYLTGILNSRLMSFVFDHSARQSSADRKHFTWNDLRGLPMYTLDLDQPEDLVRYDRMEHLVRRIVDLEKNFQMAQPGMERDALQKKIRAADAAINALVYNIYHLNHEEIALVETNSLSVESAPPLRR